MSKTTYSYELNSGVVNVLNIGSMVADPHSAPKGLKTIHSRHAQAYREQQYRVDGARLVGAYINHH
jgi:hypothetical protein